MFSPSPSADFAGSGDVVIPHRVMRPVRNSFFDPYWEAMIFPTGPSSTASPRKVREADRQRLEIASPAVEGVRTVAVRIEALAEASRSDFP